MRNQDFVRHCEATPEVNVTSCEGFKQLYRETAKTFPDQRMNIEVMVAEGDRVAFWGTFSDTGKSLWGLSLLRAGVTITDFKEPI